MSAVPSSSEIGSSGGPKARRRMSTGQRILFFVTAWLIVLMPFLFWWNTWFGRQLSDKQLSEYLHDDKKPRHIQHALVQIGERMSRHDASVTRWYPDVARLASYPVEEVRNTDAWVMGEDTSVADFHEALLKMRNDSSLMVRGNAALSLVRFGDATGRPQIVQLLQPIQILAPGGGEIMDTSTAGTSIRQGGVIAKLEVNWNYDDINRVDVRSPAAGRVRTISVRARQQVHQGDVIAVLDPATEQVWEALRALYLIGKPEDIPVIQSYERDLPDIPAHVRQQAIETEKAIRQREK